MTGERLHIYDKASFDAGYFAGRRFMEAKHRTVTERLVKLDLAGGSYENLSAIASCLYQPAFGWTWGACEILRDKLIDILEGKDGNDDNNNSDGCDCAHHRCDQHGRQVSYDELDNERHKAIAELRKIDTDAGGFAKALANALGVKWQAPRVHRVLAEVRDRLIHLLGGNQPTLSDLYGILQDGEESESRSGESVSEMTKNAEIGKLDGDGTSPNDDGTCPNDDPTSSITDELRKFKGHINVKLTPEMVLALRAEIDCIADRIDEQLDRICQQQEAVLRATINSMREEQYRCDDLVDLLRDASREYKDRHYWKQVWHDRAVDLRMERDELQEKCDRLKAKVEHQREQLAVYATMCDFGAIRALKRERNEHKHRADNAEGHVKSLERRLDAAHETYRALLNDAARDFRALTEERDELLAKLDDYDKTHVELPKDANDEYIHIGDVMDGYAKTIKVMELRYGRSGWVLISRDGNEYADTFAFAHHHNPTIEQVIRDLTLGKITEAQAVERIEGTNGQG